MFSHRYPLLPAFVTFALGIVIADSFGLETKWTYLLLLLPIGLLIFNKIYQSIISFFFVLGCLVFTLYSPVFPDEIYDSNNIRYGGIIEDISRGNYGETVKVKVSEITDGEGRTQKVGNCNIILNLFEFESGLCEGDIVGFKGKISPMVYSPELPGDKDFTRKYYLENVIGRIYLSKNELKVTGNISSICIILNRFRKHLSDIIASSGISLESSAFLDAVLLGEKDEIDSVNRDIYSNAGVAHLLALSGTHAVIIGLFIYFLLIPLRFLGLRKTTYWTMIAVMWFYAFLTGLSPSVVRAVIMISCVYIAKITSRRGNSMNSLCFAGLVILLFDPKALFSISFQLSFCAVASIIVFYSKFNRRHDSSLVIGYLHSTTAITIAALLGTALLGMYYFHKFPVYSIFANIPAALLMPIILIAGILLVIAGAAGFHFSWLDSIFDFVYSSLKGICNFFANLPGSTIEPVFIDAAIFIPFVIALAALYLFLSKRSLLYAGVSLVSLIMCIPFAKIPVDYNEKALYIFGDSRNTNIVACCSDGAFHFTTHNMFSDEEEIISLNKKHREFLAARGMSTFLSIENADSEHFSMSGRLFRIGEKIISVIKNEDEALASFPQLYMDYCLLCCGIKSDTLEKLINTTGIGIFILPKELHINHLNRYINILEEHAVPYISLRDNSFMLENIP